MIDERENILYDKCICGNNQKGRMKQMASKIRVFLVALLAFAAVLICSGMVDTAPDQSVIMCCGDGRTLEANPDEVSYFETQGWHNNFSDIITTVWAEDGRQLTILNEDKDDYIALGWYAEKADVMIKMVSPENEEVEVFKGQVEEYEGKGYQISKNNVNPLHPMVAFTFDDGPGSKTTSRLLSYLESRNAKATFFMLGKSIEKVKGSKQIIQRMKELGMEIGSHTYDHSQLTKLSKEEVEEQVQKTNDLIKDAVGEGPTVTRPPYGAKNDIVKEAMGTPIILWDVDTLDWKTRDADSIYQKTMETVHDGAILLFHDIYDSTIDAIEKIVPALQAKGYQLVTVSELAEAKGVKLKNGEVYTDFR